MVVATNTHHASFSSMQVGMKAPTGMFLRFQIAAGPSL